MIKFELLKDFRALARAADIDISKISYLNTYEDRDYFFDYIAKIGNRWINICLVNEKNDSRYSLLILLNKHLSSSDYFIPPEAFFIECNGNKWYVEIIEEFDTDYIFNEPFDIELMCNDIHQLNIEASTLQVSKDIIEQNNKLFLDIDYFSELKSIYSEDFYNAYLDNLSGLYINYADIGKTMELKRVKFVNDKYVFTGLQSFIPCPEEHTKLALSVYGSTWAEPTDYQRVEKLKHIFKEHSIVNPEYYTIDMKKVLG